MMENYTIEDTEHMKYLNNGWFRDYVGNINSKTADNISTDLKTVSELDKQIEQLMTQRNYILYGLNCKCIKTRNADTCFGSPADTVWEEYKNHGFDSDIVKNAILNIRTLFLDDSQEKCQKFMCSQIKRSNSWSWDDMSFIFEDDEGHAFKLIFDVLKYEHDNLYTNMHLNGYLYFSVKDTHDFHMVEYSYDINTIRNAVKNWFKNNYEAERYKFNHISVVDTINSIMESFKDMHVYDYCYGYK